MNMKKLFLLNFPYLLFVYPFDKLAQAFRLAPGSDLSCKLLSIGDGFTAALAGIVSGYSDNLLLRAADVTIKEGRPLILVARESPLSPIHLRNLNELAQIGVRIIPPMISYYQGFHTLEEWTDSFVERLLRALGMDGRVTEWQGM